MIRCSIELTSRSKSLINDVTALPFGSLFPTSSPLSQFISLNSRNRCIMGLVSLDICTVSSPSSCRSEVGSIKPLLPPLGSWWLSRTSISCYETPATKASTNPSERLMNIPARRYYYTDVTPAIKCRPLSTTMTECLLLPSYRMQSRSKKQSRPFLAGSQKGVTDRPPNWLITFRDGHPPYLIKYK